MSRSVFVHLMGGFGNQLFQIAAAYSLSRICRGEMYVDSVTGFRYDARYRRVYELNEITGALGGQLCIRPYFTAANPAFRCRLWLRSKLPGFDTRLVTDQDWRTSPPCEIASRSKNLSLYGYFQRLAPIRELRAEFREKTRALAIERLTLPKERIVVHCRITDINYPPSKEYLREALKLAISLYGYRRVHLVSDDIINATSLVREAAVEKIEIVASCNRNLLDDFWGIASAECQILSKSTFGWWAAFLGSAGTVIYPQTDGSWWCREMMPDDWRQIDS